MDAILQFFAQFGRGILDVWYRLSASARINLGLAAVATALFIAAVVWMGARADYVRLYDGLSPEDSAAIRSHLEEQGYPYQVRGGGSEILVRANQRSQLLLTLQDQNLPKQYGRVPGFEIFDQQDIMTNRYLQNINYMRALYGTLQTQLEALDFVDRAWVMIREAEDSLFKNEQKPSQATVEVEVSKTPTKRQIRAMVSMIAAFGGANLQDDQITVVTTAGEPLHLPPRDGFAAVASSNLEHKLEVEKSIEEKINSAFERAGIRSVITASADINDQKTTQHIRQAEDGALLSNMTTESSTVSDENLPEGPAGTQANLPAEAGEQMTVDTEDTQSERIQNFEPSITETDIVIEPGGVEDVKVMALIEQRYVPVFDEAGQATGEVVREEFSEDKYRQIIASAAGPNVPLDNVVVHPHIFDTDRRDITRAAFEDVQQAKLYDRIWEAVVLAGQILLILLGFFVARWLLIRSFVPVDLEEEMPERPRDEGEIDVTQELAQQIEQVAKDDPQMVASLLRTWIAESEE